MMDKAVVLQTTCTVKFLVDYKDVVNIKDALEALRVLETASDVVFDYLTTLYPRDEGTWRIYTLSGSDEDIDAVIKDYNNWF